MRKGGMTFDEKDLFAVKDDNELSTSYDESKFFDSFYRVDSRSELTDRSTIGHMVTKSASRFHYNAVENGIVRAIAHRDPPPYGAMVRIWEFAQQRRNLRLLDVGSGTGHWIEFFMESQYVSSAVGLEVAPNASAFLREKFADRAHVEILNTDVGADAFTDEVEGPFDYVSAIGIMFHITDDRKWAQGLRNMGSVLAPDGLIFVGGDFGWQTRNLQFHRVDEFDDWQAQQPGGSDTDRVFVNKRARSLADWHEAAMTAGLRIADLVRVESDWAIHTPENDLLVLCHAAQT